MARRRPRGDGRRLRLAGAVSDPVFVTDRHNRIVFWNQSAERILGFSAADVVGRPCAARLEGCDAFGNRYCSESARSLRWRPAGRA